MRTSRMGRLVSGASGKARSRRGDRRMVLTFEALERRQLLAAEILDFPTPLSSLPPLGSRAYSAEQTVQLDSVGEQDQLNVELTSGRPISLLATPLDPSVQTRLRLLNSSDVEVASIDAVAAGEMLALSDLPILADGTYKIMVSSLAGSGGVDISLFTSTTLEMEATSGINDTLATAQDLSGSALTIAAGAERYLVAGNNLGDEDWFSLPVDVGDQLDLALTSTSAASLRLTDSAGNLIAISDHGRIDDFTALSSETVYVQVSAPNFSSSSYTLSASRNAELGGGRAGRYFGAADLSSSGVGYGRLSGEAGSSFRVAVHTTSDSHGLTLVDQLNDDTYFDFNAVAVRTADIDTLAELNQYDVVILGAPYVTLDTLAAQAVEQYFNDGGGVVGTGYLPFAYQNIASSSDTITALNAVLPVDMTSTRGGSSGNTMLSGVSHPIIEGISDPFYSNTYSDSYLGVDADAVVLGSLGTIPTIVEAERGGRSVYLGLTYFWSNATVRDGDADRLLEQTVAWAAGGDGIDSYAFNAAEAATIDVSVDLIAGGDPLPESNAVLTLDLHYLDGATPAVPVASSGPTTAGGILSPLSYSVAAGAAGRYVASLRSDSGATDYGLVVSGGSAAQPLGALTVTSTTFPEDATLVNVYQGFVEFTFDRPLLMTSVDATDLTVGATAADAVEIVDARTLRFEVTNTYVGDQQYTATLAGITALDGTSLSPLSRTFSVDTDPPGIADVTTEIIVDDGTATVNVTLQIDEALDPDTISTSYVSMFATDTVAGDQPYYSPVDAVYDEVTDELTFTFTGLIQGSYYFSIVSYGSAWFADFAGNSLDGNGSDTPGGELMLAIDVDMDPTAGSAQRLSPVGAGLTLIETDSYAGESGDVDEFVIDFEVDVDVNFDVVSEDAAGRFQLELLDSTGTVVAAALSAIDGGAAELSNHRIATAGAHTIRVTSIDTVGRYRVQMLLGMSAEIERSSGENDTIATAETLLMTPRVLAAAANTSAVRGQVGTGLSVTGVTDVPFDPEFSVIPRALTPGGSIADFLVSDGSDVYSLSAAGVTSYLYSLDHFAHGILLSDGDLLTVDRDGVLRFVDPASGVSDPNRTVEMQEDDGGYVYSAVSLAANSNGDVYIVYSGDSVNWRGLGILDPLSGVIQRLYDFGDGFASIAFDDADRLFAITGNGANQESTLYSVDLMSSDISLQSLWQFDLQFNGNGESIAFDPTTGELYRASGPLGGGGGGESDAAAFGVASLATDTNAEWQRVGLQFLEDTNDVYRVPLLAGQWLTLTSSLGRGELELLDAAGNLLAVSAGRGSLQAIEGFIAPEAADYFARIRSDGPTTPYQFVVSVDANLRMPGGELDSPQPIPASGVVYGSTGGSLGSEAQFTQSVNASYSLFDAMNYRWDFSSDASVNDGSSDAYDGGMELIGFPNQSGALLDSSARSLRYGPGLFAGLQTTRTVYVPSDDTFARFIDSFTNDTASAITTDIRYYTDLGSDSGTTVVATSSGDQTIAVGDTWILTDDGSAGGNDPAVGHLFAAANELQPSVLHAPSTGRVQWIYEAITIGPGETVSLMSFAVQNYDRDVARSALERLSQLGDGTLETLPAEADSILNWSVKGEASFEFSVVGEAALQIETMTPGDAAGLPLNGADPSSELYYLDGATPEDPIASADNNASDGKNAVLNYGVTSSTLGRYGFTVPASPSGDFVAVVSADAAVIDQVLPMHASLPDFEDGESLLSYPQTLRFVVDADLDLSTIQASDLRVNNVAATAVEIVDGRTLHFDIAGAYSGDGVYIVSVSGGAMGSLSGGDLQSLGKSFTLDTSSPVVTASNIAEGATVSPGLLTYQVTFSEPLDETDLGPEDFTLTADGGTPVIADSFLYDSASSVATVTFADLVETNYTLTVISAADAVRDPLGNLLDGGPSFPLPSGDGTPGDDFTLHFHVDTTTTSLPTPVFPFDPLGGRIYRTQTSALIGAADDVDRFVIPLSAGQSLTALVMSHDSLLPAMQVVAPDGSVLSDVNGNAADTTYSPLLVAPADGSYTIRIASADGSIGSYTVGMILGAAAETEAVDGTSNDSIASAEDLVFFDVVPVDEVTDVKRAAIFGQGGTVDYFRMNVTAGRPVSFSAAIVPAATSQPAGGLSLLAVDGTVLAVGTDRSRSTVQDISEYVPAVDGEVIVRIDAFAATDYGLVIIDGGALDVEPNDNGPTAQPIQVSSAVIGGIAVGGSAFVADFQDNLGGLSLDQFTATGLWHVTDVCGAELPGHSAPSIAYFGIDSSCNFNTGSAVSGTLTSPPLGLRAGAAAALRLNYRLGGEASSSWDRPEVQVSTDGGVTFTTVANKSTTFSQASAWTPAEIDLAAFAGQTIVLRFSFNSGDGVSNSGLGWQIDDLEVEGVADVEDFYAFAANQGDEITIDAIPFEGGSSQPLGDLAPQLELTGPNDLVVAAGANSLTYTVPEGTAGRYHVRLFGAGAGDYRLQWSGVSGNADSAALLLASVPGNAEALADAPSRIQLTFDQGIRVDSVDASDLVFSRSEVTVSGFEIVDGSTIAFDLSIPSELQGSFEYTVAADALSDLQGSAITAIAGSFIVDRVGPSVLDTTPSSQASAPFSILTFVFDEPLDRDTVDIGDILLFTSPSNADLLSTIGDVSVDGNLVIVSFAAQTEAGAYTMTIGGDIRDVVGNLIDQDGDGIGAEPGEDEFTQVITLQSPDLVAVIDSISGDLIFGQTISLTYTVNNAGDDPALENWSDGVYLSSDAVLDRNDDRLLYTPSSNTLGPLDAAGGATDSYTRTIDIDLPLTVNLATGTYYILVEADARARQPEANEANNAAASTPLSISLPPIPDLVIEQVVVPPAALSGQEVPIQWRLINQGTGTFTGSLIDSVRLSTDANVGNDVFLGNFVFTGTIAPGGEVLRQQFVTLPIATQGERYFIFTTDANGQVFEHQGESNNVTVSSAMNVDLAPLANLQVTSVTAPVGAFSSQSTTIDFVVTNTGTGPTTAPVWYDDIYLSTDGVYDSGDVYLGRVTNPGFLEPGAAYASSATVTLPRGIQGDYQIIVRTDSLNHVFEHDFENDNITASSVFPVTLTPPADLQVQSVLPPFSAFSGQPANLTWTIVNEGDGRTLESAWYDDVYLSVDDVLDGGDQRLGSVWHSGKLDPDETYTVTRSFDLPIGISGDHFFIVVTDSRNHVYENVFETNNVGATVSATNVSLTPPPDLQATIDVAPAAFAGGRDMSVTATIINYGLTPTVENSWVDRVYLSADAILDSGDILVQSKSRYGNLGVFESYTTTITGRLPWTLPAGDYYAIFVTDQTDNVFEIDNDNNVVLTAAIPLTTSPPNLHPTAIIAATDVLAGQPLTIAWNVVNQALGATNQGRTDRLVISTEAIYGNADDRWLAQPSVSPSLLGGESETISVNNIRIPLDLPTGTYNLFVAVDAGSQQFETDETDNVFGPVSINVTQVLPDLVVENITFLPVSVNSSGQVTVDWEVRNQGAAATQTSYWVDRVYLSTDTNLSSSDRLLATQTHNAVLAAGATVAKQVVATIPAELSGEYFIIIVTDETQRVLEGVGEANNLTTTATTLAVSLAPVPDLVVSAVDAPAEGFSGQAINVGWTVTNSGSEDALGNWYDAVYLSVDQVFDRSDDVYLGYRTRPSGLAVGESYTQSSDFDIPLGIAGPWYVFVATDSGHHVFERGVELNNVAYDVAPVAVTLLPPADLVVGTITVPADSAVGATATITYTVQNQGVNPARGTWSDALFLSADGTFSLDDLPLGVVQHSGDVPGGGEYTETLHSKLPGVLAGDYQIIVRSDIRNAIIESNEANNLAASLDSFAIDLPTLELDVPAVGTLVRGESLYWSIELTAGETVRFSLDNASDDATSELFVRQAGMPDRGEFDFANNVPFQNDPDLIIPVETSGTYYVMTYGAISGAPTDFSLLAEVIPLSVFSVRTDEIGDSGPATVKISGARFDRETTFSLVDPDDPSIFLQSVDTIVENSVTAYVTFNGSDIPQGQYNVVAQSDAVLAILESAVTVTDTVDGDVLVLIDGPSRVRPDRFNPFRVQYTNDGNTNFGSPLFIVENPDSLEIGFTADDARSLPLYLFGVAPDGPSDTLRPDQIGSIPLLFRSSGTGIVNMPIRPVRATDSRTITDTEWASISASVKPAELTTTEWAQFWGRIQPRIGPTWGAFVHFVQDLHERTKDLPNVRAGDVRDGLRHVYEDDNTWRPSVIVQGRLLTSGDESGIADIPIAAYQVTEQGSSQLRGATITGADGGFTFAALPAGEYRLAIDYEGHYFDTDRDGETDGSPATFTVTQDDLEGLAIHVVESPVAEVDEQQPDFAVDADGKTHLVWTRDGQIWHAVSDAAGNWADAQPIIGAIGNSPTIVAGDAVVGGAPGLMVVYGSGSGNDAELYYVLGKRDATATQIIWSDPVAMTSDAIHDAAFDVGIAPNGKPVVLSQRLDIGDATNDTGDDNDIYSWSEVPDADFEAAMLAMIQRSMADEGILVPEGSHRLRIQPIAWGPWKVAESLPVVGGDWEFRLRASATINQQGCSASGDIDGEANLKMGAAEANFRAGGRANFKSEGTKSNCEYVFDNAYGKVGGGFGADFPIQKFNIPYVKAFKGEWGIRVEAQGQANLKWDQGSAFPSWPDKVDGKIRVGLGPYGKAKGEIFGNKAEVLVRGILSGTINFSAAGDWDISGPTGAILFRFQYHFFGRNRFFEYTYTIGGGTGSDSLDHLGFQFDTSQLSALAADNPDNFTFGIEDAVGFGTSNDYSTDTFSIVDQDLYDDSAPTIAAGPDGALYGLWADDDGVGVYRYDGSAETWGAIGLVGDDAGLGTNSPSLAFDANGIGIITFAGQDLSGLDLSSTPEQIRDSIYAGPDLFYATFDPTTDTFSADMPLFSLSGADSDLSMLPVDDGDLLAVWTHQNAESNSAIYSARWDASTQTWSAGEVITTAASISSKPTIAMVASVPTVIWSQVESEQVNGEFSADALASLKTARYQSGAWTAAGEFSFTEMVSTTQLSVSANGNQTQVFIDGEGDLNVVSRESVAGGWSTPLRLSSGGSVVADSVDLAYDTAGQAVVVWIEVVHDESGVAVSTQVHYAYRSTTSDSWSQPVLAATGGPSAGELRLLGQPDGGLLLVWTEGADSNSHSLKTAFWSPATQTFDNASIRSAEVVPGSLSVGRVASDTVLVWKQVGKQDQLDQGLTYTALSGGDWGQVISAESLIHSTMRRRPDDVSSEAAKAQSFDQYGFGITYLLAQQLGGIASMVSGAGVYLRAAGVLDFSPPEDCCKCEKYDERTVGTNEGCGSSTEVDEETCIRITTYKPCVERPRDPNDILGPEGFGEERWIPSTQSLSYRIRFENAADANAAAQFVEVTQTLDDDLFLPTFKINGFGFRNFNFTVPSGPPFYTKVYDLTEELGVLVEFTAGIDVATREAFWRLVALDPATGQPPLNPDLGLLIPNDEDGSGEGYLDYSISAKPSSVTGTRIDAQARIVFDTEEPIDTPPIFNTLDAAAPNSSVTPSTAPEGPEFTVMWVGEDDSSGSGLASYTILVGENGGDYSVWLDETTATEAIFIGTPGSSYDFVSLAADNAGNLEGLPETPDWTVALPGGLATIGDFVWNDLNDNGIQDAGETGIDGVTVTLMVDDGAGGATEYGSEVTAAGGAYTFTDVPTAAAYFLTLTVPAGYAIGLPGEGTDETLDSDFGIDGNTALFTPIIGENLGFDAALVQLGSIGGTIWEDLNSDGILDQGEPNLAGWTVYLDLNDNGSLDAAEPSMETAADGVYQFDNLRPGTYVVAEVIQTGWIQTYPGEAGSSAAGRSYLRSGGSQASLQSPGLSMQTGPLLSTEVVASAAGMSAAAQWVGLDDFRLHDRFSTLDAGTVVVIDTGIDLNHPFFGPDRDGDGVADRIIFQYDFADNDADASDQTGHGSHVAGLIASGDSVYAGIAPNAEIIALKVFGDNGRGRFADVERALQWVVDNAAAYNIDAVNLSIGDGMNWSDTIGAYGVSDELAILADIGVIAVAAAGNGYGLFNNEGLAFPAADPNTISVGAVWDSNRGGPWNFGENGIDYTTAAGRMTSFSQRDAEILDVLAPGAILTGANQFGGVSAMRGTSMAAPHVTGAALFAQSIAKERLGRSLSTAEFRYLVRQSGTLFIDGDDESDNVFNTGASFAGLNLVALAEAVYAYDGSFTGDGFARGGDVDGGGTIGSANGGPNRYVVELAPGQHRSDVDFGNRLADIDAPQVIGFSAIDPDPRRNPLAMIDVSFSEPIDAGTFTLNDFVFQRAGVAIDLTGATLTMLDSVTWQLSGLEALTTVDGDYSLSLSGAAITDQAGNVGEGIANTTFMVDTHSPQGTVQSIPAFSGQKVFEVRVDGSDPTVGGVASGIAEYEIYSRVDGGSWQWWTTVTATDPRADYTASSNTTVAFHAIAIDHAGNRESGTVSTEVITRVGDVDAPQTEVSNVDASTPSMMVYFSGSDVGGSGLAGFELFVSIDGQSAHSVGRRTTSAVGAVSSQMRVPAIQDGADHQYRFFTVGFDSAGNVEAVPGGDGDVTVMVAFDPPSQAEVTDLRIEGGSLARSYIRHLDIDLSQSALADAIADSLADAQSENDRIVLTRFDSDGGGAGVNVPLAGLISASAATLNLDFGPQGIGTAEHAAAAAAGTARNSSIGDGYYQLALDIDGDSDNGNETLLTFYRLLGDTNGDRVVDATDVQNVNSAVGSSGANPADVNGDNIVNVIDRALVSRGQGKAIAAGLPLTDPSTLGSVRVTNFEVQSGQSQRSYLQTIDTELSDSSEAALIVDSLSDADAGNDRIRLERFGLDGLGAATNIDLADHIGAIDRVLAIDFGAGGIPGGGNTNAADGYYRLSIDLDNDLSNGYEQQLHFHRLLGDVTGDGVVNELDRAAVNAAAQFGGNLEADLNGDGLVNVIDRALVSRAQGRQLDPNLERDD